MFQNHLGQLQIAHVAVGGRPRLRPRGSEDASLHIPENSTAGPFSGGDTLFALMAQKKRDRPWQKQAGVTCAAI